MLDLVSHDEIVMGGALSHCCLEGLTIPSSFTAIWVELYAALLISTTFQTVHDVKAWLCRSAAAGGRQAAGHARTAASGAQPPRQH